MEVFPGFLLLLIFAAQKIFSLEDEETEVMRHQSPGSLSSPDKARVKTKKSEVKLNWRNASEIEVTFANGTEEKIHLRGVSNLAGGEVPCLYTGSLDHDSDDSEVTVDGCKGDPQVLVEIASRKEVGGLLVLVIENEETYRLQPKKTPWNKNDSSKLPPEDSGTNNFEAFFANIETKWSSPERGHSQDPISV